MAAPAVMVVEDDDCVRELVLEILGGEGFTAVGVGNGEEALRHLRGEGAHPALILLDLMMPVMDGWQFREAQLGDPEISTIPVVVLSAVKDERVPAERHFSKPCNLEDLLDTVHEFTGGP